MLTSPYSAAVETLFTANINLVLFRCCWNIIYCMSILTSSYPAAVQTLFAINFSLSYPAAVGILFTLLDNQPLMSCNFRIMVLLNYEYGSWEA